MTQALSDIIDFFEPLEEVERRDALAAYAESIGKCAPDLNETWPVADLRHDPECADSIGIYLRVSKDNALTIKASVGPNVRTITRSLLSILCQGLQNSSPQDLLSLDKTLTSKILGPELVELRNRTADYVLRRFHEAAAQVAT